ncbi:MAG: TRAP transporter substrate-binding protein DctP [Burkholderiaceae bacterium]
MKFVLSAVLAFGLSAGMTAVPGVADAQAASIRAASCFPEGSFFSRRFESVIADLQAAGLDITYVGGAPAIGSPFTLVQKMSRGAFDLVNCTGAYYGNVLPEADALKMFEMSPADARKNGAFDYVADLHREKNLEYLGRIHSAEAFHLYLAEGKAIDKPDLTGLNLRTAPIYRAFFESLGATTQRSNLAQIYTYMENGTVAGYGWPVTGLLPDWHKVTSYRVDPGFYQADINVLFNGRSWAKLTDEQKATMTKIVTAWENKGYEAGQADSKKAMTAQNEQGIKPIKFGAEDEAKWAKQARDAAWASIIEASPKHGEKLRELLSAK